MLARRSMPALATATACLAASLAPAYASAQPEPAPHYQSQFGTCGRGPGQFDGLWGIAAAPDGSVFVADLGSQRVERFDAQGAFVTAWAVNVPTGIAVAPDGSVFVASSEDAAVHHFDAAGGLLGNIGSFGNTNGHFINPQGVAVASDGTVFVTDADNGRVQRFTAAGVFLGKWGTFGSGPGQLLHPYAISTDPQGDVYIVDSGNNRITRFDAGGAVLASWSHGGPSGQPITFDVGLGADAAGNVYIVDGIYAVEKYTPNGAWLTTWGGIGNGGSQFQLAWTIATEPGGVVFVSDRALCRVARFQSDVVVPATATSWGAVKAIYR
jgi:tripartite motif-containing protein 71